MSITVSGQQQIISRLRTLEKRLSQRIVRRAISGGLTVMVREMKRQAPTRTVRLSIGKRNKRNRRKDTQEAKAGINVGKKKAAQKPHAHLIALGTVRRFRERIGGFFAWLNPASKEERTTGRIRGDDFIRRAALSSEARTKNEIVNRIRKGIAEEVAR